MHFLCVDVGTTCSKAQIFDEKGNILFYESLECPLKTIDNEKYADIFFITSTVKNLIRKASEKFQITSIAFSSFGESFVTLDKDDNVLTYPMLYTDSRGAKQAKAASDALGDEFFYKTTGVMPAAMYSLYKLLWIKENEPAKFEKIDKLLLICDYFGYVLTRKRTIDYSMAARTGVFDISNKEFSKEICEKFGIDRSIFSTPEKIGTIVGNITPQAAAETGLSTDCVLVLGSHDQICATLGAGVTNAGEAADGMGTVECITAVFDKIPSDVRAGYCGYPIVPFAKDGLYCTYVLNLTSGSVIDWLRKKLMHGYSGEEENVFAYLEKNSTKKNEVLAMPYFGASSTPYQDPFAKGCIFNLTTNTTDGDLYRAIIEGTAYEMRLNLETIKEFGISVKELVATGGGSRSNNRIKIQSEVLGLPVKLLRSSEGGLCGLALLQAVSLGLCKTLEEAKTVFVRYGSEILPESNDKDYYDEKYLKYKKIYKLSKELEK